MLFPKKVKYRKAQRGRENLEKKRIATRGYKLSFGSFGLKAMESEEIKVNQIESARKAMTRYFKKGGKMWIRIFPDKPMTSKPPEVGMGKGKGDPSGFVAPVRPGTVIFEVDGVDQKTAYEVLRKGGAKLPVKTKIVSR